MSRDDQEPVDAETGARLSIRCGFQSDDRFGEMAVLAATEFDKDRFCGLGLS
jgi:hypothetical protein